MNNIDFLEQQAVDAAVARDWQKAVDFNKQILKIDSEHISTYLRLGFAYMQLNSIEDAKKYYRKVLKLQPNHRIASENLEKLEILEKKKKKQVNTLSPILDPNLFLEIPGKTKTVHLVHLGQKEELAGLSVGQEVELKLRKRKIEVRTLDDEFIGYLPDDVSKRLMYFIKEKSIYKTYIKESSLNDVSVFIKEEKKGTRVNHYPSFPQNPHTYLSDIQHDEHGDEEGGEHEEHDDFETETDEWMSLGHETEEKDEDILPIPHEEEEDEVEE
jgi:tetratricopeptide (TPR) repeat protein